MSIRETDFENARQSKSAPLSLAALPATTAETPPIVSTTIAEDATLSVHASLTMIASLAENGVVPQALIPTLPQFAFPLLKKETLAEDSFPSSSTTSALQISNVLCSNRSLPTFLDSALRPADKTLTVMKILSAVRMDSVSLMDSVLFSMIASTRKTRSSQSIALDT